MIRKIKKMLAPSLKNILTVSELTFSIKTLLETNYPEICVQGEISNLKMQSSGHVYFSLKDKDAQIACVLFRGAQKNLQPKDGDHVTVRGNISVYAPRGNYQIIVKELSHVGIGELLLKFEALKANLKNRGFFDLERKKPLPLLPKRIGIVTSATGAVIQDIIQVLSRRFFNFHLILNPVKVQGEGAALEIAKAIDDFNRYGLADVLIVGRGGGSLEDLFAFNEEVVAQAIYSSKIPIISAVGHETDFTIADFVADVRAPTPSAAAEIVMKEKDAVLASLKHTQNQLHNLLKNKLAFFKKQLATIKKHPYISSPLATLSLRYQKTDEAKTLLEKLIKFFLISKKSLITEVKRRHFAHRPHLQIRMYQEKLALFKKNLASALLTGYNEKKRSFSSLAEHLSSLNPHKLLQNGYSILFNEKNGRVIFSVKDIEEQDKIKALTHDGIIYSTINQIMRGK